MDFETEIYTLIVTETGITSLVTGGVYSHNLPENFDYKKPFIVIEYRTDEIIDVLGEEDCLELYTLFINIYAQSTVVIKNIKNRVRDFFNNVSTTNMRDVRLINDYNQTDFDRTYYMKSMEYKVIYEP